MNSSKNISNKRIHEILNAFASLRVGVVGDLMLDTFTYGHSDRMSPEAPVPVIVCDSEHHMPGGAGNVAVNVAHLAKETTIFGALAKDYPGITLLDLLRQYGILNHGIVIADHGGYITTQKKRIVLFDKHYARIDSEQQSVPTFIHDQIINLIEERIPELDVLIVSDYAKGVFTESTTARIMKSALINNVPVVVDTKPGREDWFRGANLFTPNAREARLMSGEDTVEKAGETLSKHLGSAILVTQGSEGMTLYSEDQQPAHFSAQAQDAVDVSGAGDTVTAVCGLALAARATLEEAAFISNIAAGLVVAKPGTATFTLPEFENELMAKEHFYTDRE